MSRFYGSVTGDASKTDATRRGFKCVESYVRGWDHGGGVLVEPCPQCGGDNIRFYLTGGSNLDEILEWLPMRCENGCTE